MVSVFKSSSPVLSREKLSELLEGLRVLESSSVPSIKVFQV